MRLRVYVSLKPAVLDPAGDAIKHGLHQLGYAEVTGVRVGKYFDLDVSETEDAQARVAQMADQLLANPVIESFRVEILR